MTRHYNIRINQETVNLPEKIILWCGIYDNISSYFTNNNPRYSTWEHIENKMKDNTHFFIYY